MMQDLKWDSLERRREVNRLILFYKAIHQETAIPFPNHLLHSVNKTRGHRKRFVQVPARTHVYTNSFFNRTIKNWNELSETVVSAITVDTLKLKTLLPTKPPHEDELQRR